MGISFHPSPLRGGVGGWELCFVSRAPYRYLHDGARAAPMPFAGPATARANGRAGSSALPRPRSFRGLGFS